MGNKEIAVTSVVTGAFGLSGQEITKRLLARGEKVRTLTNHSRPDSALYDRVEVRRLDFDARDELTESLTGVSVLYNTYWVRFPHGGMTHERAVRNTKSLIEAAERAGVRRIVHVSITNPSLDSPLSYFKGKAEVEDAICSSGLSYGILRPAVLFGDGDILINNIAYMLKRFPVFAIPGDGEYRLQPIFVKDLADLTIEAGERRDSFIVDAVGPETYRYSELVQMIRDAVGSQALMVRIPSVLVQVASAVLGRFLNDVVLTDEEIKGLMTNLLVSDDAPTGWTSLREWISSNAKEVGSRYASELERHYLVRSG